MLGEIRRCLIHDGSMEDWPERLKRMRNATRLSQAKVARALGIAPASVAQWESGRSKPSLERLPQLSDLYKVALTDLCGTDLGTAEAVSVSRAFPNKVQKKYSIAGYVAGADRVVIFDDCDPEKEGDVNLPFSDYDGLIFRVRGESMSPRYKPGELVGARLPGTGKLAVKMIGRDVIARLADGQTVLKTVGAGPSINRFVLSSVNTLVPPIYDPELEWVAPVDFHLVDWM